MKAKLLFWLGDFICLFSALIALGYAEEEIPKDAITVYEEYPSKGLVQMAWEYYEAKDYPATLHYADRCIALYDAKAKEIQASLSAPFPTKKTNQYWQLNDVATAKFIKGLVYAARKENEKAEEVLDDVIKNYKYAMAYDPRGWYWSVADGAKDALQKLH